MSQWAWFDAKSRSFKMGQAESEGPAYEIRNTKDGQLDEVVATPGWVHLEKMDWGHWWLGITLSNGDVIHVNLTSKKKIQAVVLEDTVNTRRTLERKLRAARAARKKST